MPKHEIITRVPKHAITNEAVTIAVRSDDELLGELLIAQGSIRWRPAGYLHTFGMRWERFDEFMQESGRRRKRS